MAVRKVQLEYCYKSNYFAPSDDILTLQRYGVFLKLPNFGAANSKKSSIFFLLPKGEKCGVAMLSREKLGDHGDFYGDNDIGRLQTKGPADIFVVF